MYETRNRGVYVVGRYNYDDISKSSRTTERDLNKKSKASNHELSRNDLIQQINYEMVRNLRRNVTVKTIKFHISEDLYEHLKQTYNLTYRFKSSDDLRNSFKIICSNYIEKDSFYKVTSLEFKLEKSKQIEFRCSNMKWKAINGVPVLKIRFIVKNQINKTENLRLFTDSDF